MKDIFVSYSPHLSSLPAEWGNYILFNLSPAKSLRTVNKNFTSLSNKNLEKTIGHAHWHRNGKGKKKRKKKSKTNPPKKY